MCHHNTFLVYQSMRNATLERWEKVTHISIGFAWIVAALFGITGYATFRALSQGNVIHSNLLLNALLSYYCPFNSLLRECKQFVSFLFMLHYSSRAHSPSTCHSPLVMMQSSLSFIQSSSPNSIYNKKTFFSLFPHSKRTIVCVYKNICQHFITFNSFSLTFLILCSFFFLFVFPLTI